MRPATSRGTRLFLCVALALALASCSAYVATPQAGDTTPFGLSSGDRIRIRTESGEVLDDTFVRMTDSELVCRSQTVGLASISSIERRSFSVGRTLSLIGGLGMGVVLLMGMSYGSGAG